MKKSEVKDNKFAVIITSINSPTEAILEISKQNQNDSFDFIVVGDSKSPADFDAESCIFLSLEDQLKSDYTFAAKCPTGHYARKNVGYLEAISRGCEFILETDDDNIPLESFWMSRAPEVSAPHVTQPGWLNVYRYFTDALIWPRGLPLNRIHDEVPPLSELDTQVSFCPIQQGLADANPDVDAIYRLVLPLPLDFKKDVRVVLGEGAWCPFNSQNTVWFPEAFPLLYLPSYCSFRMTDIWRSFIAQRILWANQWNILFHEPTVYQNRNEHNLMKDFEDEISGYLGNEKLCATLESLPLESGVENIPSNMMMCYEKLVELEYFDQREIGLLQAWLEDLA